LNIKYDGSFFLSRKLLVHDQFIEMKHITTCHLGTHYDFTNVDLLGQLRCKSTIKGRHIVDYKIPSFSLGYLRYILESALTTFTNQPVVYQLAKS
jgi:hypothetical protein